MTLDYQATFQLADWYKATTLSERLASFRTQAREVPAVPLNNDLARRRIQRWRSQTPFAEDTYFTQRLALDNLTESEFLSLLGEPMEAVRARYPVSPAWLSELEEAFAKKESRTTTSEAEALDGQDMTGFLNVVEPLLTRGRAIVAEEAQALAAGQSPAPFDPATVVDVLFAQLPRRLLTLLSRTLVLELNVARLQGKLAGEAAPERFRSFVKRLRQPKVALAFLREYPVLARQCAICINQWANYSLEFLRHLCADWKDIQAAFNPEAESGLLIELDGGKGDRHQDGRSVLVARFSSGFQVVYKPKALAVDTHFQELLAWLNHKGFEPAFRQLKILNRGTYGWVEYIPSQSCDSDEALQRFYQRQGGYLALLYALEAVDFHYENLIAAGAHPVLIDLESLFHPDVLGKSPMPLDPGMQAGHLINYSVLKVGLLPRRIWGDSAGEGVDISGLGAVEGQLMPRNVLTFEKGGTDEMYFTRKRLEMPSGHHLPLLNGDTIQPIDYTQAVVTGFDNMYRLLLEHRDALLSDTGPLARFNEDEIRVIIRPTIIYGFLLQESFHPDVLRNALDRDRLFDRLWVGIEYRPYLPQVIQAEREDVQKGDIPMFTTHPNSRDLITSSDERILSFFDEPGMALVRRRLQQLSKDDLEKQTWFVRASFATMAMGEGAWPTYHITEPNTVATRERLVAAARAIGDRLETLSLSGEPGASWVGVSLLNDRYWSLLPVGADLYSGLPGIGLFLGYLGHVTGEARYTALAQSAVLTLRDQIAKGRSLIKAVGGFSGWGGMIYALAHLGALWDQPALLDEAEEIVELLPSLIEQDEHLDIISGSAGCLGSLISLYQCRPSERTLAAAIQCGEKLLAKAQPMPHGLGWVLTQMAKEPLAGFSHGAAGMAWALLKLAGITGKPRYRATALAGIAYERSLFSPKVGNWPDLREFESPAKTANPGAPIFMTAWCHGAPGIGLARLATLGQFDDESIRSEIAVALSTTVTQGFGQNHSLCHGDLGNIDLLLYASQILDDPQWPLQVNRVAAIILESMTGNGWICGVPLGVETPGLMSGLAGIGYELLRLAGPTYVPSVLVFEPPRK